MKFINLRNIAFGIIALINLSCLEEIDLSAEAPIDSVLVVEGTITNRTEIQKVKLSRSYEVDSLGPTFESNAQVRVVGDNGTSYTFSETELGLYQSNQEFGAQNGVNYTLEISTNNGRDYKSDEVSLSGQSVIDDVYFEVGLNENLQEGISIFVDALNIDPTARFYRYTYEETYKIIAPRYSPFELIIQNNDFPYLPSAIAGLSPQELVDFFITKEFRPEQEQICFNTDLSNTILLEDAENFNENGIERFRVRFISRDNYIISHRYSILVKQFTQSRQAHDFYKTLDELSTEESIFSNNQPGFINGNMFSMTNASEKVVGFFEVSEIDEKRIFFNYEDVYPGANLPPYVNDCDVPWIPGLYVADPVEGIIGYSPIQDLVEDGFQHFMDNYDTPFVEDFDTALAPYTMVFPACGDCTVLGETEVPEFWIE
ncbi:MAG: DUF4249 domain-containing protein [bacterium]